MELLSRAVRKWTRILSTSLQNPFGQHITHITFIYSAVNPAIHRQNQTCKKGLYTSYRIRNEWCRR